MLETIFLKNDTGNTELQYTDKEKSQGKRRNNQDRNISLKGWVGTARSHKSSRLKLKDVSRLVNMKIIAVFFFFFLSEKCEGNGGVRNSILVAESWMGWWLEMEIRGSQCMTLIFLQWTHM